MVEARRSRVLARAGRLIGAAGITAAAVVVPAVDSAQAAGGLIISEVAPWGSGNSSYGVDWFEVTNTSGASISIAGWKVDDSSNAFGSAIALAGVSSIGAGEHRRCVRAPLTARLHRRSRHSSAARGRGRRRRQWRHVSVGPRL